MTDQWKGRQMYPKDTVSQKKLDRVADRLERRIDLQGDKLSRLRLQVDALRQQVIDLTTDVAVLRSDRE